jgi:hypothetical protein
MSKAKPGVLKSPVKPFRGYGGGLSGKRRNWARRNESPSKLRTFMQRTFGRPIFAKNKAI